MTTRHNEGAWDHRTDRIRRVVNGLKKHILDVCHEEGLLAFEGAKSNYGFLKNKQ